MNKLNRSLALLLFIFVGYLSHAQGIGASDQRELRKKEDSLKVFSDSMINATLASARFRADSNFVRGLVRSLKIKNSFNYPFDSLKTISHLYSPDSTFRIFTWQLKKDDYVFLQKGAVQIKTPDGSLKIFPLFDYSMFTGKPQDSRTHEQQLDRCHLL